VLITRARTTFFVSIVVFVLPGLLLTDCRQSREVETSSSSRILRGTIYVIGNEPFTALAIQDSLGRMHRIHGPKHLEDLLLQRQGKPATVTIVGTTQHADGAVAEIGAVEFPVIPAREPADSTGRAQ
jgi:hypothetical protein